MRMPNLLWGLGFWLLPVALVTVAAPVALAQPPEAPPTVEVAGRAVDAATGQGAPGVDVSVLSGGQAVAQARSGEGGGFTARVPLLPPGSGSLVLVGRLRGFAPALALAPAPRQDQGQDQGRGGPREVRTLVVLRMEAPRRLRVLARSTAGQAVAGAQVSVTKVWVPSSRSWPRESLAWQAGPAVPTDAEGAAVLEVLPSGGEPQLAVRKAGLATNVASVPPGRQGDLEVPLSLPASLSGRVLLGDGTPVGVRAWRIKMQGWTQPWADYDNWRMGNLSPDGSFSIADIPSLGIIGEPTYGANLDLSGELRPSPDLAAEYVPPGRGYNVLLTRRREGRTERWISYVQGQSQGFKFEEGEQMQRDFVFEPMALLRGKVPPAPGGQQPAPISYHDPKSIYSDWQATPAPDGSFEISVPVGDVTIRTEGGPITIKALKPHEVRQVDLAQPQP